MSVLIALGIVAVYILMVASIAILLNNRDRKANVERQKALQEAKERNKNAKRDAARAKLEEARNKKE